MLITNFIRLCFYIVYFLVAGQAVFYLLCFYRVFHEIPARQFINIRKLADPILEIRLRVIYYSSLLLGAAFVALRLSESDIFAKVISVFCFSLLLADVVLAKRHNIPLNARIRQSEELSEQAARELQGEWLKWIRIRGSLVITGFLLLLVDASR
jgi:hypothetical protein